MNDIKTTIYIIFNCSMTLLVCLLSICHTHILPKNIPFFYLCARFYKSRIKMFTKILLIEIHNFVLPEKKTHQQSIDFNWNIADRCVQVLSIWLPFKILERRKYSTDYCRRFFLLVLWYSIRHITHLVYKMNFKRRRKPIGIWMHSSQMINQIDIWLMNSSFYCILLLNDFIIPLNWAGFWFDADNN